MFYREREIFVDCTTAVMVIMESADRRGVAWGPRTLDDVVEKLFRVNRF